MPLYFYKKTFWIELDMKPKRGYPFSLKNIYNSHEMKNIIAKYGNWEYILSFIEWFKWTFCLKMIIMHRNTLILNEKSEIILIAFNIYPFFFSEEGTKVRNDEWLF